MVGPIGESDRCRAVLPDLDRAEAARGRGERPEALDRQAPVYFICRSGVRSVAAAEAATAAGWPQSHNVLEGFEGPHDAQHHRAVSGWKVAGLPWVQG